MAPHTRDQAEVATGMGTKGNWPELNKEDLSGIPVDLPYLD
jgi:hypothetical protein